MGRFETQLVYDVHLLKTNEYVRTFNSIERAIDYCHNTHKRYEDNLFKGASNEDFEIKTVVRIYWTED